MSKAASQLLSRFINQQTLTRSFTTAARSTAIRPLQTRPSLLTTRVLVRSVHATPKEYNGLQSAAHHFKRQRHMPYFLEYLMWVVFGSEALHLIWLKMDYKEYKERTAHKTKVLEELIERIENGEEIDDSLRTEIKMVLMSNNHSNDAIGNSDDVDDDYLNHLIASSERQQQKQSAEVEKIHQKPQNDANWMNVKDVQDESVVAESDTKDKKKPFFL